MTEQDNQPKPKRRWLRFSLRTFLILLTIFCVWLGWFLYRVERQRVAVAWVLENGGTVRYGHEFVGGTWNRHKQLPIPRWLLDTLGVDCFSTVTFVSFYKTSNTPLLFNDISPLSDLVNLETLHLSGAPVRDVKPLTGLTKLRYLKLSMTQVSDLTPLAGLTNLEILYLNSSPVSELTPLSGLTNLKNLYLYRTPASWDQFKKLKRKLPNCTIEPYLPDSVRQRRAMQAANRSASLQRSIAASTQDPNYSFLHWNVESGGNDPAIIAKQLIALGRYNILGLTEVAKPEIYERAISQNWPDCYDYIRGSTGGSDRLLILYDKKKFEHVESADMQEAGGVVLNNGRHRAPLYVRFKDLSSDQELVVVLNHLARGDAEFRTQQAAGLREWARTKSVPIIAIGDYNFDYDFHTQKGNAGFDAFMKDGVWKWIKPDPLIDTNWSDDGKGGDRYPDSLLDFNFLAGAAKDWKAECRVIVREGDFPDDDKTSDHRPVELILSK